MTLRAEPSGIERRGHRAAAERARRRLSDDARRDREKREERQGSEQAILGMAVTAIALLEAEIRDRIDLYQTATVIALQDNARALEEQDLVIRTLLDRAHVLPDGRRVFKSIDGERVFDEHGERVGREEIEPDEIGDDRPRWEEMQRAIETRERLEQERQDILDYQERLDAAEDRLDEGGLSEDKLKALEKELELNMPSAVRRQVQELEGRDMTGKEGTLRSSFNDAAPDMIRPVPPAPVQAPAFD